MGIFYCKGLVIIYPLGRRENFRGDHLIVGEQKEGSVVTENPKGGSLKTLEGFRAWTTQICLENEDMVAGEVARVIKSY